MEGEDHITTSLTNIINEAQSALEKQKAAINPHAQERAKILDEIHALRSKGLEIPEEKWQRADELRKLASEFGNQFSTNIGIKSVEEQKTADLLTKKDISSADRGGLNPFERIKLQRKAATSGSGD